MRLCAQGQGVWRGRGWGVGDKACELSAPASVDLSSALGPPACALPQSSGLLCHVLPMTLADQVTVVRLSFPVCTMGGGDN